MLGKPVCQIEQFRVGTCQNEEMRKYTKRWCLKVGLLILAASIVILELRTFFHDEKYSLKNRGQLNEADLTSDEKQEAVGRHFTGKEENEEVSSQKLLL